MVVDETIALLMYDVHAVAILDDDVAVDLIPFDEVVHEEIGVDEVGEGGLSTRCDETCWLHFLMDKDVSCPMLPTDATQQG